MTIDDLRRFCLSLPHTTEGMQWGDNLLFRVGGKMFAIASLDSVPPTLSFKCDNYDFLELQETEGVIPAPYLARAKWVQLESLNVLPTADMERVLRRAYDLVVAKLPKKKREELARSGSGRREAVSRRRHRKIG